MNADDDRAADLEAPAAPETQTVAHGRRPLSTLAGAIARDMLRERPSVATAAVCCFSCGRSFMPRRLEDADDNGRFCSSRCLEWFDAGAPAYDPDYLRGMTDAAVN